MDLQTLSQLFATTYNADPNIRKAAELQIRKVNECSFIYFSSSYLPGNVGAKTVAMWEKPPISPLLSLIA